MSFFKKLSKFRIREYESVRMLKDGINSYFSNRSNAAGIFQNLVNRVDKMSEDEFEAFRKKIPNLIVADRACISGGIILGGLTGKQHATVKSRAEVISHLSFSAGYCQFSLRNYEKAIDLLTQALNVRPKPKIYNLREVKSDTKDWNVRVTEKKIRLESVHVPSVVSKDRIEGEADEVVSFRDVEFFGVTYLYLAKTILYSHWKKAPEDFEKADKCLDTALWYLEKTRHFDFNLMSRGACWFDKGMCNYHQRKFKEAISCYNQAFPIYKEGKSLNRNLELGFADCLLYRGECKQRLGDEEAATEDLEKAFDLSTSLNQRDNIQRASRLLGRSEEDVPQRKRSALTREQIIDLGKLLKERHDLASGKTIAVVECQKCGFLNPLRNSYCMQCGQPIFKGRS